METGSMPGAVDATVEAWLESGASAEVHEWPAGMGLGHDLVDDAVNTGKLDEIYPILMQLFTEGTVSTEPSTTEEVAPSLEPSED